MRGKHLGDLRTTGVCRRIIQSAQVALSVKIERLRGGMGYHARRKHHAESLQALAGLKALRQFPAFEVRISKNKRRRHVIPEQIAAIKCELQLIPCRRLE